MPAADLPTTGPRPETRRGRVDGHAGTSADVPADEPGAPAAGPAPERTSPWDEGLLARRYGRRRAAELLSLVRGTPAPRRRRWPVTVLAVVLAVAVTWVFWSWRSASTGNVSAELVGFRRGAAETSLVVTWAVTRDPGTVVTCQLRATDGAGAEVARLPVTVNAASERVTRLVTDLTTTRPPANADVGGCLASGGEARLPTARP